MPKEGKKDDCGKLAVCVEGTEIVGWKIGTQHGVASLWSQGVFFSETGCLLWVPCQPRVEPRCSSVWWVFKERGLSGSE